MRLIDTEDIIVLKAEPNNDALPIIKANGFEDRAPDIGLLTGKRFTMQGSENARGTWRFDGWNEWDKKRWMWRDIRMVRT